MKEKSKEKQESQRTSLLARVPSRLDVSIGETQKQVGQAWVQLPHARQRSAISAQEGCSRWDARNSASPAVGNSRPIASEALETADRAIETSI